MILKVASLGIMVQIDNLPYSFYASKGLDVFVALDGLSSWPVNSLSCLCGNLDGYAQNDRPPHATDWPACEVAANVSAFSPSLKGKSETCRLLLMPRTRPRSPIPKREHRLHHAAAVSAFEDEEEPEMMQAAADLCATNGALF